MGEGDGAAPPSGLRQLPHVQGWEGTPAACEGLRHIRNHASGSSHHEQTFIHREEALAQDVAAASEFHPEAAVCGDERLRDFVATKPTWGAEKNGQAAGGQDGGTQCRQRESSVASNAVQGEQSSLGNSSCSTYRIINGPQGLLLTAQLLGVLQAWEPYPPLPNIYSGSLLCGWVSPLSAATDLQWQLSPKNGIVKSQDFLLGIHHQEGCKCQ